MDSPTNKLEPHNAAGMIVCSLALCGGYSKQARWKAILRQLCEPVRTDGNLIWFLDETKGRFRVIADPVTEALIRRLMQQGALPLPAEIQTRPVDSLIRAVLPATGPRSHSKTLDQAVRAAKLLHFAPDVIAIEAGVLPNTCCNEEIWLRYITGRNHISVAKPVPVENPKPVARRLRSTNDQILLKLKTAIRWDPEDLQAQGVQLNDGKTPEVRYRESVATAIAVAKTEVTGLYSVDEIESTYPFSVITYADRLLTDGGMHKSTLAPSTIDDYISTLLNVTDAIQHKSIADISASERENLYENAIMNSAASRRNTVRTVLEGFERAITSKMLVEDDVDWGVIAGTALRTITLQPDANLIDEANYKAVLRSLQNAPLDEWYKTRAAGATVLLRRFGLRTGELVEVRLPHLELHESTALVCVPSSELTRRKTEQAIRIVGPCELDKEELEILKRLRQDRMKETSVRSGDEGSVYLFGNPNHASRLEKIQPILTLIRNVSRSVLGDPRFRLRHFRHTYITERFLTGRNGRPDSINASVIDEWQRAFEAGHSLPEVGIQFYVNCAELAHNYYAGLMVQGEFSDRFISRISGMDARSLERALHRKQEEGASASRLVLAASRRRFPLPPGLIQTLPRRELPQPVKILPDFRMAVPMLRVNTKPLPWAALWDIYAEARVGIERLDHWESLGHSAVAVREIQQSVAALHASSLFPRRVQRRPQLSADENKIGIALLQGVDPVLVIQCVLGIRWSQRLIRVHQEIADKLVACLCAAGLDGLEKDGGTIFRLKEGERDRSWIELMGCLAVGICSPATITESVVAYGEKKIRSR